MKLAYAGNGIFCTAEELFYEAKKVGRARLFFKNFRAHPLGQKRTSIRGRGMEFFESRPYVHGDEMRSIDWRVSARFNKIHTKVFTEERGRPVYVVVDLRNPMFFASVNCFKSVLAAKIAARLAQAALNGQDLLGGMIFNGLIEHECPLDGTQSLARLISMLVQYGHKRPDVAFESLDCWQVLLKKLSNRIHSGAVIFLISDFLGLSDTHRSLLSRLKKKADMVAIGIHDPLEYSFPLTSTVGLTSGNEFFMLNSVDKNLKGRYQKVRQEHDKQLFDLFKDYAIPLLNVSVAEGTDEVLKKLLTGRY